MTHGIHTNISDANSSLQSRQIEDWLDEKLRLATAELDHWMAGDLANLIQAHALAARDRFSSLIAASPAELVLEWELPEYASLPAPQLQEVTSQLFDIRGAIDDAEQKIADIVAERLECAAWVDFSASMPGDRGSATVGRQTTPSGSVLIHLEATRETRWADLMGAKKAYPGSTILESRGICGHRQSVRDCMNCFVPCSRSPSSPVTH